MNESREIRFSARGLPVPQGSLARAASGRLYNRDAKRLEAWRSAIAGSAAEAMGSAPLLDGPVAVSVDFILPRPGHHFLPANSRRSARMLRADSPVYVVVAPDADKLLRAFFDALTGVVWRDDAQVATVSVRKLFETAALPPGARGLVRPLAVTA